MSAGPATDQSVMCGAPYNDEGRGGGGHLGAHPDLEHHRAVDHARADAEEARGRSADGARERNQEERLGRPIHVALLSQFAKV